jgi:hypothetical protein
MWPLNSCFFVVVCDMPVLFAPKWALCWQKTTAHAAWVTRVAADGHMAALSHSAHLEEMH